MPKYLSNWQNEDSESGTFRSHSQFAAAFMQPMKSSARFEIFWEERSGNDYLCFGTLIYLHAL